MKAMRRPITLLKHFVRKYEEPGFHFAEAFRVRRRPRVALGAAALDFPKQPVVAESAPTPNHGHRSRQAAAHVEGEEFFRVLDLTRARLFRELLICFENLANTSRAHRMAVANQ